MRHSDIHILVLWLRGQVMQMNHARTHYQAWWRHNMGTISYYWGESTRNQWIHGTTSQQFKTFIISLLWAWISLWTTSQAASEIKRVRVHGTPLSRRIRTDCKFRYMFQISIITSIIIYIYIYKLVSWWNVNMSLFGAKPLSEKHIGSLFTGPPPPPPPPEHISVKFEIKYNNSLSLKCIQKVFSRPQCVKS